MKNASNYTPVHTVAMEHGPQMKMYLLLKMVIFHCHVSLLEGMMDDF